MKKTAVILFIFSLLLNSCNQNKQTSQIPVVGEAIDSAAIANDTLQQQTLESSYEYAQTIIVSPKLVYDVRAYGGPAAHGEYAILRRGADNKADTVVRVERFGVIVNAFTADLNNNGKEEIYIVTRSTDTTKAENVSAFEFDAGGKANIIDVHFKADKAWGYQGQDSVFSNNKLIIRVFPFFKNDKPQAWMMIKYKLNKNILEYVEAEALSKDWKR